MNLGSSPAATRDAASSAARVARSSAARAALYDQPAENQPTAAMTVASNARRFMASPEFVYATPTIRGATACGNQHANCERDKSAFRFCEHTEVLTSPARDTARPYDRNSRKCLPFLLNFREWQTRYFRYMRK